MNIMEATAITSNDLKFGDTIRSSKSRITSLSSLLGAESHNSKTDKLGFKKLAKACQKSFASWNYESNNTAKNQKINGEAIKMEADLESSRLESLSLLQLTRRHLKRSIEVNESTNIWKSYFQAGPGDIDKNPPQSSIVKESTDESNVLSAGNNEDGGIGMLNMMKSNLPEVKKPLMQINENITNISQTLSSNFKIGVIEPFGKRVVQLKNFPPLFGVKSVVAQICGGPLEKIVLQSLDPAKTKVEYNKFQLKHSILEFWFLKPQDAADFMKYSMSGLFLINGCHILPEWAPSQQIVNNEVMPFHDEPLENIEDEMTINGARRCLIFKKTTHVKPPKSFSDYNHFPLPKQNYSELDLPEIKKDFAKYGDIMEVSPVISKSLCIAIHYFSTASAIQAKKDFSNKESAFFQKYWEWTLWYGKDTSDRSVLIN